MQNSWSNSPETIQPPKAELNPLLNPVLEKNLGRWAQVYFTNPPEAREQAVQDLLRELNGQSGAGDQTPSPKPGTIDSTRESVFCPACDGENRPAQRFCGFCGSPLRSREAAVPSRQQIGAAWNEPASEPETLSVLGLSSSSSSAVSASPQDSTSPRGRESDLQFLRTKDFGSEYYEGDPGPLRRYVLAGVVVVLLGAGYMGWPYLRAHLPTAVRTSALPAAPASIPPVQPAAAAPAETTQATSSASPGQSQPSSEGAQTSPAQSPKADSEIADHEVSDSSLNVRSRPVPASMASRTRSVTLSSEMASSQSTADGTSELLLAQRYLDGKGEPQDPATAARWLWKSVGKQNPRAALLLADMYTRGDGVSKSCGQARILLGVAADKNVAGAAKKLRDLDAGGCR